MRPCFGIISIRVSNRSQYTYMIMKQTTFIQTEALANQPRRCRDRIIPRVMPITMKIIMQAMKQMLSLAN